MFFLKIWDNVSYPYKTTSKTTVCVFRSSEITHNESQW